MFEYTIFCTVTDTFTGQGIYILQDCADLSELYVCFCRTNHCLGHALAVSKPG